MTTELPNVSSGGESNGSDDDRDDGDYGGRGRKNSTRNGGSDIGQNDVSRYRNGGNGSDGGRWKYRSSQGVPELHTVFLRLVKKAVMVIKQAVTALEVKEVEARSSAHIYKRLGLQRRAQMKP
ncbi:hypothetical protein E2C01_097024 [Portunus trituberculatus]|uniref:Uncharacterized protein n=1 Tax=Portunus trituberculatus TaxID=210409 RepID=A0A5B7JU31_PORTR|nr:hypothetical protein [Portunus trituberculatus]